eukprot:772489-Pelagomonas_calceolata.AAC.1
MFAQCALSLNTLLRRSSRRRVVARRPPQLVLTQKHAHATHTFKHTHTHRHTHTHSNTLTYAHAPQDHAKRILALWRKKNLYPEGTLDAFAHALGVSPLDKTCLPTAKGVSLPPPNADPHTHPLGNNGTAGNGSAGPLAGTYPYMVGDA